MKQTGRLIAAILCCALLTACAKPAASPLVNPARTDERLISEVRTHYHSAALIVEGVGTGNHIDSSGRDCYDLAISDVYAGVVNGDYIVHCPDYPMTKGERYLLFLQEGEDVHYAEDDRGYRLLSEAPLPIEANEVVFGGRRLTVDALKQEIAMLHSVISAPTPVLYYDTLSALAEAADEIFIGRVVDLPAYEKRAFFMRDGGAMEKAQYESSVATIEVFGSIKGAFAQYGKRIAMVHSPGRVETMQDSLTLAPTAYKLNNLTALEENGVYLFFLASGPDSKQQYYFPINPLQGFVRVENDAMVVNAANAPLAGFETLSAVVSDLHKALNRKQPSQSDTPLLIIEE